MQRVSEPENFRQNIRTSINKFCNEKRSKHLEIGIYNYTIKEWQKLTPENNEQVVETSIPHKLRKKKFINCF